MLQRSVHRVEGLLEENETLKTDYDALLKSSTEANRKLAEDVRGLLAKLNREELDREEVERELSDREAKLAELRSELSDLKQKSATAGELPDLSEKAGELLSFFKSLLPPKTKLPNGTISKIEKILEGGDDI